MEREWTTPEKVAFIDHAIKELYNLPEICTIFKRYTRDVMSGCYPKLYDEIQLRKSERNSVVAFDLYDIGSRIEFLNELRVHELETNPYK